MNVSRPFTCRRTRLRWVRPVAIVLTIVMALMTNGGSHWLMPTVEAQQQVAPVSQGFNINAEDLRFIFQQILVAQEHASGGNLLGPGPLQVHDPQLPVGLRTVDGSFNNLVPGQESFGAADLLFPRLTTPIFRPAQPLPFDPDGPGPQAAGQSTSYTQKSGFVADGLPRLASNLIVDQTIHNPAAVAANANPCGSGNFVCGDPGPEDPVTHSLFIPNITPDFGLSAPFNLMFTFFGQFFDHGLDLVTKGGGTVLIPLAADDPLFVPGSPTNFMAMTRGTNLPGPDNILGTADDIQEQQNTTTPWVDQNQTYTSHPSHQVFLRQYTLVGGKPAFTGKMLDGDHCVPRPTGPNGTPSTTGDDICNIGNWAQVKAQAATVFGIHLTDPDVFDVPLLVTDPYGHFKPGPNGFPQIVMANGSLREGNPAGGGIPVDTTTVKARRTGHAFLNDIAHNAVPDAGLVPDSDTTILDFRHGTQPAGTYDNELLDAHFITGDGRGNENIALSMVHQIFHAEHNRLVADIDRRINSMLTPEEIAAWKAPDTGVGRSGWDYAERLFQAARFGTEMQYQHLVFEEFARTMQPLINPFLGGLTSINPAISAEFAHTVYRLGHSMLPEVLTRIEVSPTGAETHNDIRLFEAFLAPYKYNVGIGGAQLNAAQAAGSIVRGFSREVGNELDEFIVDSVRNQLVGLPLDLAAINIARGRSEGIASLNNVRKQLFAATHDAALKPYNNWFDFGLNLKHHESLVNFIAAYGTDPTITSKTSVADRRAAAQAIVNAGPVGLMSQSSTTSGLDDVDFWVGGLAERQAVFGGLLGSTFNYVFEKQLENLQDGDRFYYLQRTDGLNFRFQLEGNSFAELIRRNSDFSGGMDVIFHTADFIFNAADLTGTAPLNVGNPADGIQVLTDVDGTKIFFDPNHTGKNITFNGGTGNDRFTADVGDDTLYGNDGNDRLDGFEGNDTLHGGNGDDVLFGGNGDDVLKGGGGNDALSTGPGFGADLAIGGDGNDFMLGGDDGVEYFGGPGNDIIVDGSMRSEGMFGGDGDDWIFDGEGHDGGLFGDGGNVFDLLAGLSAVGGDDVLGGGPGQDNHFGEGGDDIMLMSEGSNKFFGDYGFDWITLQNWPFPEFVELGLLALPNVPVNFTDLRNKYRFVDGASGWDLNDHIAGTDTALCNPPGEIAECFVVGMELTAGTPAQSVPATGVPGQVNFVGGTGAAKITGLTELMAAFHADLNSPAIPGIKGVGYMGGDILLGGLGSDLLEGKGSDDLIDGDRWLHVQLRAVLNNGTIKIVDDPRDLVDDVFQTPQRLNPGNISIMRSIVTPDPGPADCGAAHPHNCDTAVFANPLSEYSIIVNADGSVVVRDDGPALGNPNLGTGTDTLLNIEQLQFSDVTIPVPARRFTVPGVVGLPQATAEANIRAAGLRVGAETTATSPIIHIGSVVSSNPKEGTTVDRNSLVDLVISLGTVVPDIVGLPLGDGQLAGQGLNAILEAGLVLGTQTQQASTTLPAGTVISTTPAAGTAVDVATAVNVVISSGPPRVLVPNVANLTVAQATTAITNAGLVVGVRNNIPSPTVPNGSVITTNPAPGTSVIVGSAVNLDVSSGPAGVPGLVMALGFDETTGTTAIDSSPNPRNGVITQAVRVAAGKFGGALRFDGINDWVTITDVTNSKLDLSTGMTLEAWVNPSSMSGWECVLMKERGVAGEGLLSYALYAHDGAPLALGNAVPAGYIRLNNTAATTDQAARGTTRLVLNTWTHLATTYDGTTQRFYVNGVLVGSNTPGQGSTNVITQSNGSLRIGGDASSTGEFFNGMIDEVRIYNRALSAAEIATDMITKINP